MAVFNVGIIGYGLSAKVFHIPFVEQASNLRLHSIVQRRPTAGDSAPSDHPAAKHFASAAGAFLAQPDLDLVVISTPPGTHAALARAALEAGKHVLVEKPFVPTAAEADDLAALARARGRLLCVYQNRRWDADFATARALVASGALGRVFEFETHFDRFRPGAPRQSWKARLRTADGGGPLYDLGVHVLDQAYVLFGLPDNVAAKLVNQREGRFVTATDKNKDGDGEENYDDEPDSLTLLLTYAASGLLVVARVGVLCAETRQLRFWVRGSRGSYHKTGLDPQEDQLRAGMRPSDPAFGREGPERAGRLCLVQDDGSVAERPCPNREPETYLRFYEMLGRALETGREEDLPVTAAQAADVLRIIEAARESAKTGRDVPLRM